MFRSAASDPDFSRHHFSVVVLANFQEIAADVAGGLSGLFLPVPPRKDPFPDEIAVTCWGKPKVAPDSNNRWSCPDDEALHKWKNRGFIASLTPTSARAELVRIFGCTIQRLPRENSLWTTPETLTQCDVRVGRRDAVGVLNFHWV